MSSKSSSKSGTFWRACAIGALAIGIVGTVAPARAMTVTDLVTFSITGTYATDGDPTHGYQGAATASGSFDITFDPTQLYLAQPITGIITNLSYSVTDPYFNALPLALDPIQYFAFDGSGTLTLSSDPSLTKNLSLTMGLTIGINGWAYGTGSAVWYSQDDYGHTLTGSGTASIETLTPIPAALPLFGSGLGALGLLGWRRKRKSNVS